jgi:nicotinamide phosphoribosyltransferase
MVKKNGKPGGIVSAVSDSYDIYEACRLWGTELKQDIIDSGAKLVVRPDSGHPATVVLKCLQILEQYFGSTINEKGFRVLNNVGVLQGDGITIESIKEILDTIIADGYSADNLVFGQGGALLQIVNRDDQKFAMKCSAAFVNGKWVDVFKDPITDPGKQSKKGRLKLVKDVDNYITISSNDKMFEIMPDELQTVFTTGKMINVQTFDEIRECAKI